MFYDRFYMLCQASDVTPTQVARDLGIRQSTVSMWKKQGTTPKYETIQKLSNYFDVHADYLLGKIDYMPPKDDLLNGPRIETLPVSEAAEMIREAGIELTAEEIKLGLQQRVYPFGDCIMLDTGEPIFYIYKKLLLQWITDRSVPIRKANNFTEIPRYRRQEPAGAPLASPVDTDTPTEQDAAEGGENK